MTGFVTVLIENSYECGYEHNERVRLPAPDPDKIMEFWEETVHDLTGTGHDCGQREDALYEVQIVEADDPALIGMNMGWQG